MTTRGGGIAPRGRGGMGSRGRIHRSKTYILPFNDYAGKQALMVFENRESCPLPPLYSFAFYFTHPDVTPENVHPAELLQAIRKDTPLHGTRCPIHIKINFLPVPDTGHPDEACVAHYCEEKRKRGDYTRQIEAFENATSADDNGKTGTVPGFVPSYIQDRDYEYHNGLLFIYQGADWRTNKQLARRIEFDPISQEEYIPLVEGTSEPEILPLAYSSLQAIQQSHTENLITWLVALCT
ncbi:hypothetical protein J1614_000924 [Plenodomus biglobosus]|nr:hypothetical protein J1614_000924 [Plenodomus biglobosus]